MKNLNDKTYRHTLIERYLDADTSTEEENALIDFYRHCKEGDLTEEDLSIRNLMLGIASYTLASSDEKETSPMVSNGKQSKNYAIRISAILLAAAMIAGLIFLVFPIKDMFSSKTTLASYTPASTVIKSNQALDDDTQSLSPAEEMERQDSLFLAATQNTAHINKVGKGNSTTLHKKHLASKKKIKQYKHQEEISDTPSTPETGEASINDLNHYYEVASLALPTAEELKIDKQGDNIVISTTDEEGNTQYFTIDTSNADEGMYQIHPIAQLNELH